MSNIHAPRQYLSRLYRCFKTHHQTDQIVQFCQDDALCCCDRNTPDKYILYLTSVYFTLAFKFAFPCDDNCQEADLQMEGPNFASISPLQVNNAAVRFPPMCLIYHLKPVTYHVTMVVAADKSYFSKKELKASQRTIGWSVEHPIWWNKVCLPH